MNTFQFKHTDGQGTIMIDVGEVLKDFRILLNDLKDVKKELTGMENFVLVTIDHLEKQRDGKS